MEEIQKIISLFNDPIYKIRKKITNLIVLDTIKQDNVNLNKYIFFFISIFNGSSINVFYNCLPRLNNNNNYSNIQFINSLVSSTKAKKLFLTKYDNAGFGQLSYIKKFITKFVLLNKNYFLFVSKLATVGFQIKICQNIFSELKYNKLFIDMIQYSFFSFVAFYQIINIANKDLSCVNKGFMTKELFYLIPFGFLEISLIVTQFLLAKNINELVAKSFKDNNFNSLESYELDFSNFFIEDYGIKNSLLANKEYINIMGEKCSYKDLLIIKTLPHNYISAYIKSEIKKYQLLFNFVISGFFSLGYNVFEFVYLTKITKKFIPLNLEADAIGNNFSNFDKLSSIFVKDISKTRILRANLIYNSARFMIFNNLLINTNSYI